KIYQPLLVTAQSDVYQVGDEAILLYQRSGCPVAVGRDRVFAGRLLLEQHSCHILLSDDGLQHYRLARDLEIVVVDAARHLGNERLLPSGPLREPQARFKQADFIVQHGSEATPYHFTLEPTGWMPLMHT